MSYSREEIEELGENIIGRFLNTYNSLPERVDIEVFVTDFLDMKLVYETFAEKDMDRMAFTANGKTPLRVLRNNKPEEIVFPARTVVLDSFLQSPNEEARRRFAIAHEAAHDIFDRDHGGTTEAHFYSAFDTQRTYSLNELYERMCACEWQANAMAAQFLMPKVLLEQTMMKIAKRTTLPIYGNSVLSQRAKAVISKMAGVLGVSYKSLWIQLRSKNMFEHRDISEYMTRILNLKGGTQ